MSLPGLLEMLMVGPVASGDLVPRRADNEPVRDPAELRSLLTVEISNSLESFARLAQLVT